MNKSTLVRAISGENCISFRTVSRSGKSPHWFYILRNELEELEYKAKIIVHDINSFAILSRDVHAGTVEIEFTWLGSNGHNISGYKENVTLLYNKLVEFVRDSGMDGESMEWKALSINHSEKRPKMVFKGKENIHAALRNRIVRRKLVRFLRDQFDWPQSDKIEFYNDFIPYSFVFHEIREGKIAMVGGLILHRQEDMERAYYSIHT